MYRIILLLLIFASNSLALSPQDRLEDKLEQRAQNLFKEVKCVVCLGQPIDESDTEFSMMMRKLIRKKILENKNDYQIKQELVLEFGDNILISPLGLNRLNFIIWLLPAIFALFIIVLYLVKLKKDNKYHAR